MSHEKRKFETSHHNRQMKRNARQRRCEKISDSLTVWLNTKKVTSIMTRTHGLKMTAFPEI